MNRRGFLAALGTALAGATLDPERLLWVPGAKTIFLPPVGPVSLHDDETGISIRLIRRFDIAGPARLHKLDVLFGYAFQSTVQGTP